MKKGHETKNFSFQTLKITYTEIIAKCCIYLQMGGTHREELPCDVH